MNQSISIHALVSSVLLLAGLAATAPISAIANHYGPWDNFTAWKQDVDLNETRIEDPSVFKAYTVQDKYWTRVTDPQLFLFDGDGHGIYASASTPFESGLNISQAIIDDSVIDTLTDPDLFGGLTAGLYLLGISWSDMDPKYTNPADGNKKQIYNARSLYSILVNSHTDPNASGIADYEISGWGGAVDVNPDDKPYHINLEEAHFAAEALPEPGVMILLGAGLVAMGMIPRRKCGASAAA